MADIYADVIRVNVAEASLTTTLREKQWGIATDTFRLGAKLPGGTMKYYSADSESKLYTDFLEVRTAAEQIRASWDASIYTSLFTNASGLFTITPTGSSVLLASSNLRLGVVNHASGPTGKICVMDGDEVKYLTEAEVFSGAGLLTGSGTTDYIPIWTSSSTLGDSPIRSNGSTASIGVAPSTSYLLNIQGNNPGGQFRIGYSGSVEATFKLQSSGRLDITCTGSSLAGVLFNNPIAINTNPSPTRGIGNSVSFNTSVDTWGYYGDFSKTSGASDQTTDYRLMANEFTYNQSGGVVGDIEGNYTLLHVADGDVGTSGSPKGVYGSAIETILSGSGSTIYDSIYNYHSFINLDNGTVTVDVCNYYGNIDQEAANTVSGNIYGLYLTGTFDGTVTGLSIGGLINGIWDRHLQLQWNSNAYCYFTVDSTGYTTLISYNPSTVGRIGLGNNAFTPAAPIHLYNLSYGTSTAATEVLRLTADHTGPGIGFGANFDWYIDTVTYGLANITGRIQNKTISNTSSQMSLWPLYEGTLYERAIIDNDGIHAIDTTATQGGIYVNNATGEVCIYVWRTAGATITKGQNLRMDLTADDRVIPTATDLDGRKSRCCIALDSGTSGNPIRVALKGVALVLPKSGMTATRGYGAVSSSSEAGRADENNNHIGNGSDIGKWINNGTGAGVATLCLMT